MKTFFIEKGSPEYSFLMGALRGFMRHNDSEEYGRRAGELNWQGIIDEADMLDVFPFLYGAIANSPFKNDVPAHLFLMIEKEYYANLSRNLRLLKEAKQIAQSAGDEGARPLLLGGISLLGSVYEDYGLRHIGDIDMLVSDKDKNKVFRILRKKGYSPFGKYADSFCRDDISIDIKTDIISAGRIASRKAVFPVSDSFCFEGRLSHCEIKEADILAAPWQLIESSLHLFKHSFSRIMWSIDIAAIIRKYSCEEFYSRVISLAESNGVHLPLYYCLKYADDLRLAKVDGEVLETLKRGFREKWFGRRIYSMLSEGRGAEQISEILAMQVKCGISAKFKFFFESLFPRKRIMKGIYPKCPVSIIYAAYIPRFFSMLIKFFSLSLRAATHRKGG